MRPATDTADVDVTKDDVGSEGGSPGNIEVTRDPGPATGSEARDLLEIAIYADPADLVERYDFSPFRRPGPARREPAPSA